MRTLHGIIEKRERLRPGVWCILGFVDLKWKARHCRPVPSNLPSCPNCWRWTEPLILTAPTTLTETTQTSVLSCGRGLLKSLESEFSGFLEGWLRTLEFPQVIALVCSWSVWRLACQSSRQQKTHTFRWTYEWLVLHHASSMIVLHLVTICNPKQKHTLPQTIYLQLEGKVHEDLHSRTPL